MVGLVLAATLLWTNPSSGQRVWIEPSEDGDSIRVECSGGPAIHQLQAIELWFYPNTGGGWRKIAEKTATGREGQPDSITFDQGGGGHAYVIARNPIGRSCASTPVYVSGSIVTGIPDGPPPDILLSRRFFDVNGRLVRDPNRSGIYFRRDRYVSGLVTTKKVLLLK